MKGLTTEHGRSRITNSMNLHNHIDRNNLEKRC